MGNKEESNVSNRPIDVSRITVHMQRVSKKVKMQRPCLELIIQTGHVPFTLLLFGVLLFGCNGAGAESTGYVNRLNWGVKFQLQSVARPTTAIWFHTYGIPLPTQVFSSQFVVHQGPVILKNGTIR